MPLIVGELFLRLAWQNIGHFQIWGLVDEQLLAMDSARSLVRLPEKRISPDQLPRYVE